MQLLWWSFMVTITTTYCKPAVDVERTVAQVQNILKQNVQLPRLTREEIIELLNDIRAEDAKSKSTTQSQELDNSIHANEVNFENEINEETNFLELAENAASSTKLDINSEPPEPTKSVQEISTKRAEPSLMVVLPYTPRDGYSLQDLYTRPPRIEMVSVTEQTLLNKRKRKPTGISSSNIKLSETLTQNAEQANKYQKSPSLTKDLEMFLDNHGLQGQPDQSDFFLLPLEGFKPLPPIKPLDDSVELPENILLSYDLISPSSEDNAKSNVKNNNFLFEPLRPQLPVELDASSSEFDKTVLPLEIPKSRKTKAVNAPSFEPVDYDSIKVIPLQKGINPINDLSEQAELENELRKRQTNNSDDALKVSLLAANNTSDNITTDTLPTTTEITSRDASTTEASSFALDSAVADSDSGASIADLEESFGGPVPSEPGDSQLPPPKKNGFYWMLDWNSFLEVGDGDTKVNIRFEPKLGDPQMFLPISVP